MPGVPLGLVISDSMNSDVLGITDRPTIIRFIQRAYELAGEKTTWNPQLVTLDLCADGCGKVTIPSFVEAVMALNVNGNPAYFRNQWYEYHINGRGDRCYGGSVCNFTWDDKGEVPCFQDLTAWSCLAAIVEDPRDGQGNLSLTVRGVTMDQQYNEKIVTVQIPLLTNFASTDPAITQFKKILQVAKPVTVGYVKLIAFPPTQGSNGKIVGYYDPNETNPSYRRIQVNQGCSWVRAKCRRKLPPLVNDWDVIPLASSEAIIKLLKAIRYSDTGDLDRALAYEAKAVEMLQEYQSAEDGPGVFVIQVDPGMSCGTIDYR